MAETIRALCSAGALPDEITVRELVRLATCSALNPNGEPHSIAGLELEKLLLSSIHAGGISARKISGITDPYPLHFVVCDFGATVAPVMEGVPTEATCLLVSREVVAPIVADIERVTGYESEGLRRWIDRTEAEPSQVEVSEAVSKTATKRQRCSSELQSFFRAYMPIERLCAFEEAMGRPPFDPRQYKCREIAQAILDAQPDGLDLNVTPEYLSTALAAYYKDRGLSWAKSRGRVGDENVTSLKTKFVQFEKMASTGRIEIKNLAPLATLRLA